MCVLIFWCVYLLCRHMFFCLPCVPLGLHTSSSHYIGFADGACRSTWNPSSAAWVLYDPNDELINLQGIFLGWTTNNTAGYSAVIELLSESVSLGIRDLVVKLDLQLVVLQLNCHYLVRNPCILRFYLRIRLLERHFYFITYPHIPRNLNTLTDALANFVLDRHLHHL